MGLFSSAPAPANPKASSDGAYEAPDRSARSVCWSARDAFFECLDRNDIVDGIREKDAADRCCGKEARHLDRDCASSWVTYFKQRRVMEHNRRKTIEKLQAEGARPIDEAVMPNPRPASAAP